MPYPSSSKMQNSEIAQHYSSLLHVDMNFRKTINRY